MKKLASCIVICMLLVSRFMFSQMMVVVVCMSIAQAGYGLIYAVTNAGDVVILQDMAVLRFFPHEETGGDGINCLFPDPDKGPQ